MQKKALLIVVAIIAVIGCIFIVYKIFTSSAGPSDNTVPGMAAKIEKASKEEKELFSLASKYEKSRDFLALRETYQKIMETFPNSDNVQKAQEGLENTNVLILFSSIPTPDSVSYEIQKGDTLAKIAKKFSNTQDMILKANGLRNPKVVPLGRKLKVHNEKFSIIIDKSQNILTLKSADKIVKTYRVSTGINNCTPVGTFKIVNKIKDPVWYTQGAIVPAESPDNILGSIPIDEKRINPSSSIRVITRPIWSK